MAIDGADWEADHTITFERIDEHWQFIIDRLREDKTLDTASISYVFFCLNLLAKEEGQNYVSIPYEVSCILKDYFQGHIKTRKGRPPRMIFREICIDFAKDFYRDYKRAGYSSNEAIEKVMHQLNIGEETAREWIYKLPRKFSGLRRL